MNENKRTKVTHSSDSMDTDSIENASDMGGSDDPIPPDEDKLLYFYFKDHDEWFKDGISSDDKARQLEKYKNIGVSYLKSPALGEDICSSFLQPFLKLDLWQWLQSGKVAFIQAKRASNSSGGGASIEVNLFENSLQKHKDPNNVVDDLADHIQSQTKKWQEDGVGKYFAAYTVLFQSSGLGKTHLIFQVMKARIYGLYLCCRAEGTSTYPPRSPIMDWLIKKNTDNDDFAGNEVASRYTARFLIVMKAALNLFNEWRRNTQNQTPEEWFQHQAGTSNNFIEFQQGLSHQVDHVWKEFKENGYKLDTDMGFDCNFVFFIDEGRTLLNANIFRDVRRCFRRGCFSSKRDPFALFTDTLSTLSNFAPKKEIDPSARQQKEGQGLLFPPFYFVNNMDIFKDGEVGKNEGNVPMYCYGRPLWKAYWDYLVKSEIGNYRRLVEFAQLKLLKSNGDLSSISGEKEKKGAGVACLACRASLRVYSGRRLASDLVGGHMAVCTHVYEDREAIVVDYPSEPLLAQASSLVLQSSGSDSIPFGGWKVALEQLQLAIQGGDVDTGRIGELVQRMIFLLAIDITKHKSRGTNTGNEGVSAHDFLETLVGDMSASHKAVLEQLKSMYVCFNHFLPLQHLPSHSTFEAIAQRRAATICKPGQNGIDHELPLMDESLSKVVGTIAVQTKNVAQKHDSDYGASAGWKMSREFAFHGSDRVKEPKKFFYFALYHNVGYKCSNNQTSCEIKQMKSGRESHLWGKVECRPPVGLEIVGLDLPFFGGNTNLRAIKKKLKELCDHGRDPLSHIPKALHGKIHQLSPLVYNG